MDARRRLDRLHFLQIIGHDHTGDRALIRGDTDGTIDHMPHLRRDGDHVHVFVGHIFEQGDQIDLLLIVTAQCGSRLLTNDGKYRLMILLGVIQAV